MRMVLLRPKSIFLVGFIVGFIAYFLSNYAGSIYNSRPYRKSSLKRPRNIEDSGTKEGVEDYKVWSKIKNARFSKVDLDAFVYGSRNFGESKPTLESDWLRDQIAVTCVVFVEKPKLARTIRDTWGGRCNELLFFSRLHSTDDDALPVIDLGVEFTSSWQLLCETMRYIWTRRDEIPVRWLIFVKDDTMVVAENLRYMLAKLDHRRAHYLGHAVVLWGQAYNAAQAGYVLSYGALRRLMELFDSAEKCSNGGKYWKKEDYDLGKHLKTLGIHPSDTRDADQRGTFHEFPLNFLLHGSAKAGNYYSRALYPLGPECCSNRTVTFNVGEADRLRTTDYLLYQLNVFEGGVYGNQPGPTSMSEDEVWRSVLREEFNLTDVGDVSSERYFQIWRSKYSEPELFVEKFLNVREVAMDDRDSGN